MTRVIPIARALVASVPAGARDGPSWSPQPSLVDPSTWVRCCRFICAPRGHSKTTRGRESATYFTTRPMTRPGRTAGPMPAARLLMRDLTAGVDAQMAAQCVTLGRTPGLRIRRISSDSDSNSGLKIPTPTPGPTPFRLRIPSLKEQYDATIFLISLLIATKWVIWHPFARIADEAGLGYR